MSSAPRNWVIGWSPKRLSPPFAAARVGHAVLEPDGRRRRDRHLAHHLDATGHDEVLNARHHRLRREVDGLLRGPALPVHRRARHVLGQPGRESGDPADVGRLRPHLPDTAPHDVVDRVGVGAGARQQRLDDRRAEVRRDGRPREPRRACRPASAARRRGTPQPSPSGPRRTPLLEERPGPLRQLVAEEEREVEQLGGVERLRRRQVGEHGERLAPQPDRVRGRVGEPARIPVRLGVQRLGVGADPRRRTRAGRRRRPTAAARSSSSRAAPCAAANGRGAPRRSSGTARSAPRAARSWPAGSRGRRRRSRPGRSPRRMRVRPPARRGASAPGARGGAARRSRWASRGRRAPATRPGGASGAGRRRPRTRSPRRRSPPTGPHRRPLRRGPRRAGPPTAPGRGGCGTRAGSG